MLRETAIFTANCAMISPLLTVIITIRTASHYDMISRLKNRLIDTQMPDKVSFLVVDEGSPDQEASEIFEECRRLKFDHIQVKTGKKVFCAATARNIGASYARSKYIMHEDVDLFPYVGYYQDLLSEIELQGLDSRSDHFLTVPAIYLSEEATELMLSGNLGMKAIIHDFLTNGPSVKGVLPASSAILVNRLHYLSIGGYNEAFNGWGLEDLEYAYRLVRSANMFLPPQNPTWLIEGGYNSFPAYKGWRSQFRLHGDLLARKGTFALHAHHPKDPSWRNKNLHGRNKALFNECIKSFDTLGHTLPPIPSNERGKSLIFGKGTFAYNPALLPLWGKVEVKGYGDFEDIDIITYLRANRIDRVIFTNPYANETRLATYRKIKAAGIPFIVVERGALTDSMFIDDTGFCCESTRYRREYWPKELGEDRLNRVQDYIATETASSSALEKQGTRLGPSGALHKLGLPLDKNILFIPFQSRSDTTVNHFAGPIGSFDNFVDLVREVTKRLPMNWVVIFKKHPLSDVLEEVPGAIDIGDMHIKDALEISSYVLLMNSGVGVLSVLFDRPVIYTAQAFYADDALNRSASTPDQVLSILEGGFEVDRTSRLCFLSYLIEDFYSFGKFTVREKIYTNNARLTVTDRIDYYRVNMFGERLLDQISKNRLTNIKAPIYDIFREWIVSNRLDKGIPAVVKSPTRNSKPSSRKQLGSRAFVTIGAAYPLLYPHLSESERRQWKTDPKVYFGKVKHPVLRGIRWLSGIGA